MRDGDTLTPHRGSSVVGWLFMGSVFGPMLIVGLLWWLSAAMGVGAGDLAYGRERMWDLMVVALMLSGLLLAVEGAVAGLIALLRGQRLD